MFLSKFKKINKYLLVGSFLLLVLSPIFLFAQSDSSGYVPLAPIKNYTDNLGGGDQLSSYLNNMFTLGISLATGLAVIMIVIGGIQLISTDSVTGKLEGRDKITSALWGLILALAAYIILQTINPDLLKTQLNISSVSPPASQSTSGGT